MGPEFLAEALKTLPQSSHKDLLVGYNTADDAGVFRINDTQALVQTVDFFPPIVDDPYWFGQIAAANALSDVFAMGGKPLTALNIVGFPKGKMPPKVLTDLLRGGREKIEEAGAVVVGGHSIKDQELKYGVAVTGLIDPNRIVTNSGAREGDRIFLTKPLGTGLITTGIKRNAVGAELAETVTRHMAALNAIASELMMKHGARAATDVTGFGLLGHAFEMAEASQVTIRLHSDRLPLLPQALELAEAGMIPGGANDNRTFLEKKVSVSDHVTENLRRVVFDPQTSGGLLVAIPKGNVDAFRSDLKDHDLPHQPVGVVGAAGDAPLILD